MPALTADILQCMIAFLPSSRAMPGEGRGVRGGQGASTSQSPGPNQSARNAVCPVSARQQRRRRPTGKLRAVGGPLSIPTIFFRGMTARLRFVGYEYVPVGCEISYRTHHRTFGYGVGVVQNIYLHQDISTRVYPYRE